MIELGKIQSLRVDRKTSIGVYLGDKDESILLPKKQVPPELDIGDEVEVFVYRDSEDRMIATTKKPKITLGELSVLKVIEITRIGAFLDWGLEKDLFLPFKEQTLKIQVEREYLVGLYIDKSNRLCATMKVYSMLNSNSPYKENDIVEGYVYQINKEIGAFLAVDFKYHGLIKTVQLTEDCKCGRIIKARVNKVKKDGKLDLLVKEKAYKQMKSDADIILERLNESNGFLPFNDKSSPIVIKEQLNMSKSSFKRSVGRLLKEKKIQLTVDGMKKKQ